MERAVCLGSGKQLAGNTAVRHHPTRSLLPGEGGCRKRRDDGAAPALRWRPAPRLRPDRATLPRPAQEAPATRPAPPAPAQAANHRPAPTAASSWGRKDAALGPVDQTGRAPGVAAPAPPDNVTAT